MPPPSAPARRIKAQTKSQPLDETEDDFDELLQKLRNKKHEDDCYDESEVRYL